MPGTALAPLILGALLLRQLTACKVISVDQQKVAGILPITQDEDRYGVLQFLGPYYRSPKPLNGKPVYQSDPVVEREVTSFLFYDNPYNTGDEPLASAWKITRNNPWVKVVTTPTNSAPVDHLGPLVLPSWLQVYSNAATPLDIAAGSSWQVAQQHPNGSGNRLALNNIHIQVNCADGKIQIASPAAANAKAVMSELHMQLRFFKETVDSFSKEKQDNFITSLRAVVADRIIQEYEQGRVEIQQYKLKIYITKITLEETSGAKKVVTPAISCANAPSMPESSKDGWYPCEMKLSAEAEKLLLPQPDIMSIAVDARLQSSHFVIQQMVSMVKDVKFPRDLELTFDANPEAQLNGRIEVSDAKVEKRLWKLPSRVMHYHRISHDTHALNSRASNGKRQELMKAISKASKRRRQHRKNRKTGGHLGNSVIPAHLAKHLKWHHWTLIAVIGFLVSVLLTIYKAQTLFSKEGMRARRIARARGMANAALHARHTRRPMRSTTNLLGSKSGSFGGATRRRPSAGGGRNIDI
jgi:hypothetical protein